MPITNGLSHYLKEKRVAAGLTQSELGRKIGYDSGQLISNYERNICGVPMGKVKKIIKVLHLDTKRVITLIQDDQYDYLSKTLGK
jgi:transcriptional regulator with XRE-family HTH domain